MSNSPRNSPCAPAAGWKVTASMPVISFSDASARAYTSRQPCASFTSCNGCTPVKPSSAAISSSILGLYFIVQEPSG